MGRECGVGVSGAQTRVAEPEAAGLGPCTAAWRLPALPPPIPFPFHVSCPCSFGRPLSFLVVACPAAVGRRQPVRVNQSHPHSARTTRRRSQLSHLPHITNLTMGHGQPKHLTAPAGTSKAPQSPCCDKDGLYHSQRRRCSDIVHIRQP